MNKVKDELMNNINKVSYATFVAPCYLNHEMAHGEIKEIILFSSKRDQSYNDNSMKSVDFVEKVEENESTITNEKVSVVELCNYFKLTLIIRNVLYGSKYME